MECILKPTSTPSGAGAQGNRRRDGKTGLNSFLLKNKLRTHVKRGECTHLDLSGGVINVPRDLTDDFLRAVANAYDNNEPYYIIETKTPICRAFMDLDFLSRIGMNFDIQKTYITVIQKTIKNLFDPLGEAPDTKFRVVVCTTDKKNVTRDNKDYLKTGVHLLWPEWYSTKEILMKVRIAVIESLEKTFGPRENYNTHGDVVDESVFKGSGLRILGALKMEKCKVCKDKREQRANCEKCDRKGKIEDKRRYLPYCVLDSNGNILEDSLKAFQDSSYEMFRDLSIRTYLETLPPEFDILDKLSSISTRAKRGRKKNNSHTDQGGAKKSTCASLSDFNTLFNLDTSKVLIDSTDTHKAVTNFIRSREFKFNKPYKNIDIKDIFLCGDGQYYTVTTSCKLCLNTGREHMNNNIFFYVDHNFLYQKCHCTCEVIRPRGRVFCKDWRSDPEPLTSSLKKKLFPSLAPTKGKGVINDLSALTIGSLPVVDYMVPAHKQEEQIAEKQKIVNQIERFLNDLEHTLKNNEIDRGAL